MLSFGRNNNNLSGLKSNRLPHLLITSKESIFRPLLYRGSLAVEAALVLPLFLFFLMTLLSYLQLADFSMRLQQLMYQEGLYLSQISFDNEKKDIKEAEKYICNELSRGEGRIPVEGGIDGLDFSKSNLDDPEFTIISVEYDAKLNFDYFHLFSHRYAKQVTFHNWVGYVHGLEGTKETGGEVYVYITQDSEVYHRDKNCSHIKLSIVEISGEEVSLLRNEYGKKYVACAHCRAKVNASKLYVTKDGGCYHNSLECSGLMRSITAIPLSHTGNRRPCKRCGY